MPSMTIYDYKETNKGGSQHVSKRKTSRDFMKELPQSRIWYFFQLSAKFSINTVFIKRAEVKLTYFILLIIIKNPQCQWTDNYNLRVPAQLGLSECTGSL